jgi:hypothetical protein
MVCNCLKRLDSGLAVIPDPDPGRNDGKRYFGAFYEIVKVRTAIYKGFP